jgi:hypothetical protein
MVVMERQHQRDASLPLTITGRRKPAEDSNIWRCTTDEGRV